MPPMVPFRHASGLSDLPEVNKATLMNQLPVTCAEPDLDLDEIRRHIDRDEREGSFELYRGRYYLTRGSTMSSR